MFRIAIAPHWVIGLESDTPVDTSGLLTLLAAVQDYGSLAQGARSVGLSYRNAWGQVKQAEARFGAALITSNRGQGSALTELALKLIWADKRIAARLSPLFESLASELETEIDRTLSGAQPLLRINASHGFAVAALVAQMEAARMPVELRYRNSLESVAALARGECDMAGFHVPIGEFEPAAVQRYRRWLRADAHRLVHLATRTQGLFVARGNPLKIEGIQDLRRPEVRFVNRPDGSGTRMLTELMLERAGIRPAEVTGYSNTELTHAGVAAYIGSGMADAGIGVQTAAHRFGLTFIPLLRERYFFAVAAAALNDGPVHATLRLLQTPRFRSQVAALVGYNASETGRVLTLDAAFGEAAAT